MQAAERGKNMIESTEENVVRKELRLPIQLHPLLVDSGVAEVGPSRGDDDVVHVGSHEDHARRRAPRAAQPHQPVAHDGAVHEHESRMVFRSCPRLRCDGARCLSYHMNLAALKESPHGKSLVLHLVLSEGSLFAAAELADEHSPL